MGTREEEVKLKQQWDEYLEKMNDIDKAIIAWTRASNEVEAAQADLQNAHRKAYDVDCTITANDSEIVLETRSAVEAAQTRLQTACYDRKYAEERLRYYLLKPSEREAAGFTGPPEQPVKRPIERTDQ